MSRTRWIGAFAAAAGLALLTASAFALATESQAAPKVQSRKWTQCAQHCGSFDRECACIIMVGGTCYVKLAQSGSCLGVECFDTLGHECGD